MALVERLSNERQPALIIDLSGCHVHRQHGRIALLFELARGLDRAPPVAAASWSRRSAGPARARPLRVASVAPVDDDRIEDAPRGRPGSVGSRRGHA